MRFSQKIILLLLSASFCVTSASLKAETKQDGNRVFSDDFISFPIPKGTTVKPVPEENSYVIFTESELFFLKLRGNPESPKIGEKRTEAARAETLSKQGKAIRDGEDIMTVGTVSDVSSIRVEGSIIYFFTHAATVKRGDEEDTGYSTIGFNDFGGYAIWLQHTSANQKDHPDVFLRFLNDLKFKPKK